jgi:membrane protease YdiL (CAAX protease family)
VTIVAGVAVGVLFKLATKALLMPFLGAPAVNAPYHYLAGNPEALLGVVATILISAAFCEEVLFRGCLFERLGKLLGDGRGARVATVLISTALFASAHFPDQRLPGVELAVMTGLVFGGIFAWRRQLWFLMVVHAAFDLTAVALIYGSWEESIAHLFFR